MKTISFLISFLLFSIFFINSSAAQVPEPVLDVEGNPLNPSSSYYMVSVFWGAGGGGVTLANIRNETCPLDVVQQPIDLWRGLPLQFTPVNPSEGVIPLSTDLNIEFQWGSISICRFNSLVWKVDKYDESTGQYFITTDGVKGNPGADTITNWFAIEKSGSLAYKLVYCPKVCPFCKPICKDVGRFSQDGYTRLALSDSPFLVVFRKAC